jgi:hypothetical protein
LHFCLTFARPSYIFWLDHLTFFFYFCSAVLRLAFFARPPCIFLRTCARPPYTFLLDIKMYFGK